MFILPQLPKDFNPNNVGIKRIIRKTNKKDKLSDIPDEEGCRKLFHECIYGDLTCKHCCMPGIKFNQKNYVYCPHCKHKYSMKADSPVFGYSNLTFRQVFLLIFCWQKQFGIMETMYCVELSYPRIRAWFTRLRSALTPSRSKLGDEVAIDGTYIGKRKSKDKHGGKYKPQHLVAGFIELGTNKVRFHRELHKDRETVEALVQTYVKPNTYIYTDELQSYNELHLLGYHHIACNHSKGIFGVSNYIEAVWSSLKRSLTHIYRNLAFTTTELDYILREYELRHNEPVLFYNVINYLKLCGCSKLFK